ncbi:MAG: hypothetical protein IKW00_07565 [Clostridia bacterium]|nr:hypothetical protein [Clostridia bacterium]
MDFTGRVVLSFIEEDNIQRAYFRIRPLLTQEGALTQQDIDALPDEGYLRIVPDKNEQHTFKDRMRELGSLCVLDLKHIPPEAIKIRNNKNYAPQRGENNQYIVYSDAVQAVPQQLVYEVITAETGDKEKLSRSMTALCYVRSGGNIFGPVSRATGLALDDAAQLPPDSEGIYAVTMPDGAEKLFYWAKQEEVAKPAHKPQEIKKETPATAALQEDLKLSGMPLYQTTARRQNTQRAHNPLMDVVDQQMRAGKIEAPGAVLTGGAVARQVENPMEAYKRALGELWPVQEMQWQAVEHLLSMTGVKHILDQQLAGRGTDAVTHAMNSQIQDLEAERLSILMQLERGKKNLAELRAEALHDLTTEENDKLAKIRRDVDAAREDVERINAARAQLIDQRDALVAEMKACCNDAVQLSPAIGGRIDLRTLVERVRQCLRHSGVDCTWDDAVHLLVLLAMNEKQIEIAAPTACDGLAAAHALSLALGAAYEYDDEGFKPVHLHAGGNACAIAASHFAHADKAAYQRILVDNGLDQERKAVFAAAPWPTAHLKMRSDWAEIALPSCTPVSADALRECVMCGKMTPPQAALKLIEELCAALAKAGSPVAFAVKRSVYAYLSAASVHMEGGVATAMDYAVSAYILPYAVIDRVKAEEIKPLLSGLPRSTALLNG